MYVYICYYLTLLDVEQRHIHSSPIENDCNKLIEEVLNG